MVHTEPDELTERHLAAVAVALGAMNVAEWSDGTYAGGLTKFEPKEVERLWCLSRQR